jgi:Chaperone of endosialidase
MKKALNYFKAKTLILFMLVSFTSFSQEGINYQGVARDANDDLLVSANITLDVNIYKTSPAGTLAYNESHNTTTDVNGVFSVVIGQGIPTAIPYNSINWAEDKHFLNVWLNGTDVGTTEFVTVPYTLAIGKWQAQNSGLTPLATGGSIFLGNNAGANDDLSDNNNIAIGNRAMENSTATSNTVAIGFEALQNNTIGIENTAIGHQVLSNNTEGDRNTGIGFTALLNNTTGGRNTAFGNAALRANITGGQNTAIGQSVMSFNTTGDNNTAIGRATLLLNTTGNNNTAIGTSTLQENISGDNNTANGRSALFSNTVGSNNTAIGYTALSLNTTGSGNVALGRAAGFNETGSNKLYIDNSGNLFPLIYGEFDNNVLGFNANVGIGTQSPATPLQITSGTDVTLAFGSGQAILGSETGNNLALDSNEIQARNNGATSTLYLQGEGGDVNIGNGAIIHASDRRLKRDIEDLTYGLKEILKLEPKEYNWKGKTQENKSLGLIAQDVKDIINNVVTYDKEIDRYGVSYTELIPVLIKAMKEQQAIINSQTKTIKNLDTRLQALEASLSVSN